MAKNYYKSNNVLKFFVSLQTNNLNYKIWRIKTTRK